MSHHTRTRRRDLCTCPTCHFPDTVHGTTGQHADGCDCDFCARAAETGRRLRDYILRTSREAS